MKIKEFLKRNFLIVCFIIIALIRLSITQKLPIQAFPKQVYDDSLMVKLTKSIIEGHWLGNYDSDTLVKGVGFPVFLSILKYLNISYLFGMDILYILACMYFIYVFKDEINNNLLRIIVFIIMLFNPISYAELTYQRVYRSGIGIFQTIFIFSAIYKIYKIRDLSIKKILPHVLIASINMVFLWHSREDGMWILPFLVVSIIITIMFIFINEIKNKHNNLKNVIMKTFIILMPIWILVLSTLTIKTFNYIKYGVFVEKETSSYFGKALSAFYEVKPNDKIDRVDNTREKIDRICEVSESLNSIKPNIYDAFNVWTVYDGNPNDSEVENGWFSWALKYAVSNSGKYLSPQESNEFYKNVYDEIEDALNSGKLEREENIIISSLPPFREEYKKDLLKYYLGYVEYIYDFRDIKTVNNVNEEAGGLTDLKLSDFAFVTGNSVVQRNSTNIRICGWYFLNNKENFKLYLTNEYGEKIAEISRFESPDIINSFSLNPEYNYRFDFVYTDIEKEFKYNNLYISIYNELDEKIDEISLEQYLPNSIIEGEKSTYSLALVSIDKRIDPVKTFSDKSVKILNRITKIYSVIGKPLFIVGIIIYVLITILAIISSIKEKAINMNFNVWLILTAMILSIILVLIGVVYTGLTSCYTLIYMYLAVAYPLFIMFSLINICYVLEKGLSRMKKKA